MVVRPDEVELYLESHVTIDPVFDEQRNIASTIAASYGFKLVELLMQKRKDDTPEQSKYDTFMTGHSKSRHDITVRTKSLIMHLRAEGYKVRRYKIEDTIIDSRTSDEWGLIPAGATPPSNSSSEANVGEQDKLPDVQTSCSTGSCGCKV